MHDSELKKLLIETHPVRPGQEERAWAHLRERLSSPEPASRFSFLMSWRTAVVTCSVAVAAIMAFTFVSQRSYPTSFASVVSQSPGVYATTFYSHTAQAQVVWLNGLDTASDGLSYMDPTTVVSTTSVPESAPPDSKPKGL